MEAGKALPVAKETNRPLVLASVMLAMFMAAVEATIVATAMPSIVGDLGGFSLFSWVFSVFLLMQAVTIPIYGKLADLYGRKPVFVFGTAVFLLGSLLCGFARTMQMLIFFRLVQGLGTGAVQAIATTIVGDIYTLEERARVQGYLSSVWGISSVVGPALGGVMVQYVNWAWVFWLNIPIGVLAVLGITLFLAEKVEKKQHKIDYLGSALLFVSISSLMVVLIQGGTAWVWSSLPVLVLMACSVFGLVWFVVHEGKAAEPMMPLDIWHNRLIFLSNAASLTTGIVLIGISSFLPAFVQGVMGESPTVAGFTLAMMSIGWPLAAAVAGRLMLRFGYRRTALAGGLILCLGAVFFVMLQPEKGPVWAGVGSFLVGVGMGLATTTFVVAIQSSVEWQTRGAATASNMFMRLLGSTLGASLLGGVLNTRMSNYLRSAQGVSISINVDFANVLLDPARRAGLSQNVLAVLETGLSKALHSVYWGVLIFAAFSLLLIAALPQKSNQT